jgi:hypothetical protein
LHKNGTGSGRYTASVAIRQVSIGDEPSPLDLI